MAQRPSDTFTDNAYAQGRNKVVGIAEVFNFYPGATNLAFAVRVTSHDTGDISFLSERWRLASFLRRRLASIEDLDAIDEWPQTVECVTSDAIRSRMTEGMRD